MPGPKGKGKNTGAAPAEKPGRDRASPLNYGPRTGDDIKSVEDLRAFAGELRGEDIYTHATRDPGNIDSILKDGLRPPEGGQVFATPTVIQSTEGATGKLTHDYVRDLGAGYVVFQATGGKRGIDFVERGLEYPEHTWRQRIPPSNVVKVVRSIPLGGRGQSIREDQLARFAASNQGLRSADVRSLPKKYQRWFNLPQ